ncbi:MAG: response regulator [Armatimonadota bacterium]|nr:response regulator [Armatimonadota bacterium]MDR7518595.1 response regulator [Armatimonadota bacterium]MDR7548462.1 response regulator [Armatimonadota bacterium]
MSRPSRILVVDDQPAHLALVRKILAPAGFDVREARSGAEALAAAQEAAPALILLDMHLPDLHGLDVLRRLRDTPWGAGIRVVAMSALADPEDREVWLGAGCAGVIEKPIDPRTFVREISGWLPGIAGRAGKGAAGGDQGQTRTDRTVTRLGEVLVVHGLITEEQLARALEAQSGNGRRLGQILVEQGALTEDDIAWALSHQLGYPYIFLTPEIVDAEAVRRLPEEFLRDRRILPILAFGGELTLAMADPTDQQTVDEVAARTGLQVKRALALASNIEEMQQHFAAAASRRGTGRAKGPPAESVERQYLQFHLVQALQQGATEIHFEPPGGGQARVRYRLQGVLVDRPAQPADLHTAILHYLRDLTGAEDGRAGVPAVLRVGESDLTVAATFLPSAAGEAAAVFLYPSRSDVPDLAALGVSEELLRPLRQALRAAWGVVLIGCADRWLRSTLLHGLIPAGVRGKVWTLETLPVYRRPTITQTVITSTAEAAASLVAATDAGTDLVAVDDTSSRRALAAAHEAGRIRPVLAGHPDADVAGLLGEALDACGAGLVAAALRGVLAAREIHLLCPACKQPSAVASGPPPGRRPFTPLGCDACGFTGYKGRRVLADVWTVDPPTRLLLRSGRAGEVFARLHEAGSDMRRQAESLMADGLVSAEDVLRVAGDA